jgi:hypothetical protein
MVLARLAAGAIAAQGGSTARTVGAAVAATPGVAARLQAASSAETARAAWGLVHSEYVRAGILQSARPHGIHAPAEWLNGSPYVFVASRRPGVVDATLSMTAASKLPAETIPAYAAKLRELRESGARLAEIGLMARNTTAQQHAGLGGVSTREVEAGALDPIVGLFGAAAAAARRDGVTHIVLTVHPRHERYYRAMGFTQLAGELPHPTVDNARAVLLVREVAQPFTGRAAAIERAAASPGLSVPSEAARRETMLRLRAGLARP